MRPANRLGRFRLLAGIVGTATILAMGCSSHPEPEPVVPQLEPVVEPAPPPPPPPEAKAPGKLQTGLSALAARDYDAAYARFFEVVELCGNTPLGQQALLLIAASQLDPRNPDPRRNVAAASTAVLLGEESPSWVGLFAESLYLIALKLGATKPSPTDPEAWDISWRLRSGMESVATGDVRSSLRDEDPEEWADVESSAGDDDPLVRVHSSPGPVRFSGTEPAPASDSEGAGRSGASQVSPHCEALWPSYFPGHEAQSLPAPAGSSYPAQIAALRERIGVLEEELERIRRIVTEP